MGAMKQLYTASRCYDRGTGASLCPHPKMALEDYKRGARWARGALNEKPSREVLASRSRAKGMEENGRRGRITYIGDREYMYTVESTAAYAHRTKGDPMGEDDVYWHNGALRIEEDGERIQACQCSCPAWKRGYAEWRGMRICKHVIWAWINIEKGDINYAPQ